MFGENEKKFVDRIVNHLHYIAEAQKNIKEKYGVDSEYDEEKDILYIKKSGNVNESLSVVSAKHYAESLFEPEFLTIEYSAK